MAANVQDSIVLFGDSLTQNAWQCGGLAQLLADAYARQLDVINRGFSGYNSEWGLAAFEQCFAKQHEQQHVPKVRLLTIWFGANDAATPPSAQHVPLPRFISNLKALINMVTLPTSAYYSPDTRIVLITPPPVNTEQRVANLTMPPMPESTIKPDRDFEATKAYAMAVLQVGAEEGSPVADVWTRLWEEAKMKESGLKKFLYDGLHLSADGYKIVYGVLMEVITKDYPELLRENLPFTLPLWKDMEAVLVEES